MIDEYTIKNMDFELHSQMETEIYSSTDSVYCIEPGRFLIDYISQEQLDESIKLINRIYKELKRTFVKGKIIIESAKMNEIKNSSFLLKDPIICIEPLKDKFVLSLNTDVFDKEKMLQYIVDFIPKLNNYTIPTESQLKVLNINVCTDILASCGYVFRNSILKTQEWFDHWFTENFINVYLAETKIKQLRLDFNVDYDAVLQEIQISTDEVFIFDNIVEKIKSWIDENYYIKVELDEYYIKNKRAYERYHMVHHSLVYGYNDKSCCFYMLTYFDEKGYQLIEVDYFIFWDSYVKARMIYRTSKSHIRLLKIRNVQYQRNINKVLKNLYEYLNPIRCSSESTVWGSDIYKTLEKMDYNQTNTKKIGYMTYLTISQHFGHLSYVLFELKNTYPRINIHDYLELFDNNCKYIETQVQTYLQETLRENNMQRYRLNVYLCSYNEEFIAEIKEKILENINIVHVIYKLLNMDGEDI